MKFTLSWLKDHLDTDADASTIADKLTSIGLEVESVEDSGARLKDFIVAYVISAEKHPNADKLKLCMVDDGSGSPIQVVCGAPNAHTGMKGVFARPGVVIPASGDVLKIGTIRGVESRGMLCSGRELLLSDDHDGIIELQADAVVGEPAAKALGLNDPVIDVAITPNRGDCTSVYGIARDLAAAGLGRLKTPPVEPVAGKFPSPKKIALNFTPEAASACPQFCRPHDARREERALAQMGAGPLEIDRAEADFRLVDVSNLIAHDRGRPLHVFDADKLSGNMQARLAKEGEQMLALDGKTYTLDSEMCVIADDKAARGIAGVMGGEDTGCSETTTNVFIESALFDPVRTAATGRKLQLQSDARYRFERGVDPEFRLAGSGACHAAHPRLVRRRSLRSVDCRRAAAGSQRDRVFGDAVKRLGGLDVPKSEIIRILTNLGFAVTDSASMSVTPPSWRGDVDGSADLVEEVVRIYGLTHVPSVAMSRPHAIARAVLTPAQRRTATARRALAARGFNETISFSFVPRAHAALFGGGDEARQLENPIAADLDAMRPSLLPSLLAAAPRNQARGFSDLMLFEIGAAFQSGMPGDQQTIAAGIRIGPRRAELDESGPCRRRFRRQGRHAGGAGSGDGRCDDRAGESRRGRLVSPRPLRHLGAWPEDDRQFRRAASQNSCRVRSQSSGGRIRDRSRRHSRAQKQSTHRIFGLALSGRGARFRLCGGCQGHGGRRRARRQVGGTRADRSGVGVRCL